MTKVSIYGTKKEAVINMLNHGMKDREIAETLGVSTNYIGRIRRSDKYEALYEWERVTRMVKTSARKRRVDLSKIFIARDWR